MSVADAIGVTTVTHKGQGYDVAPLDHPKVISAFQQHLKQRALEEVDFARSALGMVAGDVAMRAYLDNATAGVYDFGSPFWLDCITKHAGHQKVLLWAALRAKSPQVTKSLSDDIYKFEPDQVRRIIYGEAEPDPRGEGDESPTAAPGSAS